MANKAYSNGKRFFANFLFVCTFTLLISGLLEKAFDLKPIVNFLSFIHTNYFYNLPPHLVGGFFFILAAGLLALFLNNTLIGQAISPFTAKDIELGGSYNAVQNKSSADHDAQADKQNDEVHEQEFENTPKNHLSFVKENLPAVSVPDSDMSDDEDGQVTPLYNAGKTTPASPKTRPSREGVTYDINQKHSSKQAQL